MKRFTDYIYENHTRHDISAEQAFEAIAKPEEQISCMLENIQIAISDIFGISRNDIGISIIYKIGGNSEWQWINQLDHTGGLGLNQIVNSVNSSFSYAVSHSMAFLFFPDKRVAINKTMYSPEPKDSTTGVMGSILVADMGIGNDIKYLPAYLCISTYGKQLCGQKDISTQNKIEKIILPAFIRRLQMEFSLLYIKDKVISLKVAA